jgi:hypothetical protein
LNKAKDLKKELPDTQGFSRSNLFSMRKFYSFYANASMVQQAAAPLQNNDNQINSPIVHHAGGLMIDSSILIDYFRKID